MRHARQHILCTQGIVAFEMATSDGKRPGYIWRFVQPDQVTVDADHQYDDSPFGGALTYNPHSTIYTITMSGRANGLYVADMDDYFADADRTGLNAQTPRLGP